MSMCLRPYFGQHNLAHLDEIKEHGGYTNLIEALPLRLLESDVLVLGVVCDADTHPTKSLGINPKPAGVAGYELCPSNPCRSGLVIAPPANSAFAKQIWGLDHAGDQIPGIFEKFPPTFEFPPGDQLYS